MVTASHLPFNRNGFKFCTEHGGLEKADIADILARAARHATAQGVRAVPEPYADAGLVMGACLHTDPSLVTSVRASACRCTYIQGHALGWSCTLCSIIAQSLLNHWSQWWW